MKVTHPAVDELQRLLRGELPNPPAEAYERHLMECEVCQRKTAEMRVEQTVAHVKRAAAEVTPLLDDDDQVRIDRLIGKLCSSSMIAANATPDCSGAMLDTSAKGTASSTEDQLAELRGILRPAEQPDELGRLGSYRVLRLLGAGGMGGVFLAEDLRLNRLVALKVMRPRVMSGAGASERFLREAKTAAAVRHDHVVTVFEVGQDNGVPFLALELLEGESLADRLSREPALSIAEAVTIARQIAEGLAAAHAKGLIHRDIKPANAFLATTGSDSAPRVKLLDFGLARPTEDEMHLTESGLIIGTPAYMAPEQASGDAVDSRADLFSLGTVLYQLTTGKLPFAGRNALAILHALANRQPEAPETINRQIPHELSELIIQLLSKSCASRPASALELVQRFRSMERSLIESESLPDSTRGHEERTPCAKRRARRWTIAVSLIALAFISTVTALVWRMYRDREEKPQSAASLANAQIDLSVSDDQPPSIEKKRPTKLSAMPIELDLASGPVWGLSWSNFNEIACGCDNGQLFVVDGKIKQIRRKLTETAGKILTVHWNSDGTRIAASGWIKTRVWDNKLAPSDPAIEVEGSYDVAWSPDGQLLACALGGGPEDRADVPVWNFAKHSSQKFVGPSVQYHKLNWSSDGEYLAGGCYGNSFCVWSKYGRVIHSGSETNVAIPTVRSVAWKPNSGLLAVGSADGQIWFWNVNGEPISKRSAHNSSVTALAWSPDGLTLATGGDDGAVRILGDQESEDQYFVPSRQAVLRLAWNPDGNQLAAVGQDGILRFWSREEVPVVTSTKPTRPVPVWSINSDRR